jgi:hypothetical protein
LILLKIDALCPARNCWVEGQAQNGMMPSNCAQSTKLRHVQSQEVMCKARRSCAKPGGHVQSQEHDSNVMPLEQILAMLNHICRARDKRGHDGEKHDSIPAEP